jgi:ethanolamine ammonia-lyase small subunit
VTREELTRIVEEEVRKALEPAPPEAAPARRPRSGIARWLEDPAPGAEPPRRRSPAAQTPADPAQRRAGIEEPANPERLSALVASTPSRIGVGRAGVRYRTGTYLALRADHAVAKDAVYSEAEDALVEKLGCLPLKTRCENREDFLLNPARGRRLDDASMARLAAEGTRGAQVQVILADGLSAWAAARNGPELLPLLQAELTSAGFSVGRPLFVRFARVGVQDPIGVALGNRATAICLGERPGLGTGDSLSIYLAYGPELDQDNAKKNCISNVRALGIRPPEAAREAVEILRRAFAAGRGGVAL